MSLFPDTHPERHSGWRIAREFTPEDAEAESNQADHDEYVGN